MEKPKEKTGQCFWEVDMRVKKDKDFLSFFEESTGRYMRTGILVEGKDTGEDPFMASFPELLDVGIMGHCIHGRKGLCLKAGVECYQDGLHCSSPNMALSDFEEIARQCEGKTFQFALGGCGDPDEHEHFEEILASSRAHGIVPSFTTSGLGFTREKALLCKKYCGAVAVSWYRSDYTLRAIDILLSAGVKTNIHYVLSRSTLAEAIRRLRERDFPEGINAVIFLLHKPVGLGTVRNVITGGTPGWEEFLSLVTGEGLHSTYPWKIGFDSCTVPALVRAPGEIDLDSLDTCEGARFSAYISADMKMMPCSFDNQGQRYAVDLRSSTIEEAWRSAPFEEFRRSLLEACPDCALRGACRGGCPICREIVICPAVQAG